ncbi:MAG: ribonuclease P protein component [Parcubacteria group bacterium]|jgi:ribonuclease P protein component
MLPKKNRIRKDADFGVICRYGRTFAGKGLVLKVRENKLNLVRIGVSVGLKFSRKAVTRNRIKRQSRAFFCQNLAKIVSGVDIIIIVGKGWDEKVNPGVEIGQILRKNGLIKE